MIGKLLPLAGRVRVQWRIFRRLDAVSYGEMLHMATLSVLMVFFEVIGIAMFYPVFKFAEAKGNLGEFASSSRLNSILVEVFAQLGLSINLGILCFISFAFILARQVVNYYQAIGQDRLRYIVAKRLAMKCFGVIFSSESRHIRNMKSSELATLCGQECQDSASLIKNYISLFGQFLSILAYSSVLIISQPLASAVAIAVLVSISAALSSLAERSRRASDGMMQARRQTVQFLTERFRAWKLIKLASAQDIEAQRFNETFSEMMQRHLHIFHLAGIGRLIFTPTVFAFLLGAIYFTVEVLSFDVSGIALFVLIMLRLQPVVQQVNGYTHALSFFDPALQHVNEVLQSGMTCVERGGEEILPARLRQGISFRAVSYVYPDGEHPALNGISFTLPAASITAIIGPSGSGKSTLIDLLPRFINASEGRILVEGRDIGEYDLSSLRGGIAYVTQEPFIFDGSVAENIRYLRPDLTEAEMRAAARLANAEDFIDALPNGFRTMLGESGARLSGGQKQRIALSRAFAAHPRLLILDEPTSALDGESDEAVRSGIKQYVAASGAVVVVVAHRLSMLRDADQVVLIEAGRVKAAGPAADVLAAGESDFDWNAGALPMQETN